MITGHEWKGGENTGGINTEGAEYTAELHVFTNDPQDTGVAVIEYLKSVGIWFGTEYNVGNDNVEDSFLNSIAPPTLVAGSALVWSVRLTYTINLAEGGDGGGGGGGNPINDPPKITTNTAGRNEVVQKAIYYGGFTANGFIKGEWTALTNSAKIPYSPAPEREVFNRIIRVERNFPNITIGEDTLPTQWVNEKPVMIFDWKLLQRVPIGERCLRCLGWSTEPRFTQQGDYVRVTFEGEIKDDTWDHFLLDKGEFVDACNKPDARGYFTHSRPQGTAPVRINVDAFGYPVESLLNGNGDPLPECSEQRFYGQWGYEKPVDVKSLAFFEGICT